jgi:hypothetical protein
MAGRDRVLWFGPPPAPGLVLRLHIRGMSVDLNPVSADLTDYFVSGVRLVVFNHDDGRDTTAASGYSRLPWMIDHGVRGLVLAQDRTTWLALRRAHLTSISATFDWDGALKFMPDCTGVHFDEFLSDGLAPAWHACAIDAREADEGLPSGARILVQRAFPRADSLVLQELPRGFSGSRVFMAYEHRKEESASIAHRTQPRLVKVGPREAIATEIRAMKAVSPFIPFDLRPNLEIHVDGFVQGVFVADFVDHSESMLRAAQAGRAEAALSNLFNRTMGRWRECGDDRPKSEESLASAARRLRIIAPELIMADYLESPEVQHANIDLSALWTKFEAIQFKHRVATIHGDLHGDNVRVRGDDAILIDLGSVKGDDTPHGGAPLCFDVAMLEVALIFGWADGEEDLSFRQAHWFDEIQRYYRPDVIGKPLPASSAPRDGGWMFGCLKRIRAFGHYQQDDPREYPLALAVAMLRMCKHPSRNDAERGRRVKGLVIAASIIEGIHLESFP